MGLEDDRGLSQAVGVGVNCKLKDTIHPFFLSFSWSASADPVNTDYD